MRCAFPTCDHDSSQNSFPGISFYRFPVEPSLRDAWMKALNQTDWKPEPGSIVCSEHFLVRELMETARGHQLLNNLDHNYSTKPNDSKVCRICLTTNGKMCSMADFRGLQKAYETLTGILTAEEEQLPRCVCVECADRLMNCYRFRRQSLRAHSVLMDVFKDHGCVTVELIHTLIKNHNPFGLDSNPNSNDDLCDFDDKELEGVNKDTGGICDVKLENFDENSNDIKYKTDNVNDHMDINKDVTNVGNVASGIKVENDDEYTWSSNLEDGIVENYNIDRSIKDEDIDQDILGDCLSSQELKLEDERETKGSQDLNEVKIYYQQPPEAAGGPTDETFRCDLCHYRTDIDIQLLDHLKIHAVNKKRFHCEQCDYKTDRKSKLNVHYKKHLGDKPYSCNVCHRSFKHKWSVKTHMVVHAEEKSFPCDLCDKKFRRKDYLDEHSTVHMVDNSHLCKICNKTFPRRCYLQRHIKIHSSEKIDSSEKTYSCDICEKSFKLENTLKLHLKVHSGVKYCCNICNKEFIVESYLKRHLLTHNTEKNFSCQICKKAFTTKSLLRNHSVIHSDKKPHSCHICQKSFVVKIALKRHLITHTNEKLFVCDICDKSFRRRDQIMNHISRIHSHKKPKSHSVAKKND